MGQACEKQTDIRASALELIGNTPLVALDRLYTGPGRLLAKCEFMNPGGSIKDRASYHMIQKARLRGELKPGDLVIEATSGNQGCGLAVACSVLGHPLTLTMSKGNTVQRAIHMEALGATCIRVPQVEGTYGNVTNADLMAAKDKAISMEKETGAFFVKQFLNEDNIEAHYTSTGPEIWHQTAGRVNAFVTAVGTSGTFMGVSKFLKKQNPKIQCYVVEPDGCEPIKGKPITKASNTLQGSSYGVVPDLFKYEVMNDTITVTDEEAEEYMHLIGKKEGLYVGYTSGANVCAAVKLLKSGKLPKNAWVVTILFDTGLKYTPVPESLM
ncbi:cysteine synthase B-like [Pieris brassicae]|uniref:Tryptophan synthase beta chain-like PALP domain-containing protein n=1 Tax=Pieris brassicae TaxID=7116 RepID=A0A9P0TI08_PIEBR|nr:cysteine synthase B-like [Pieris brassicae]CAH4028608.1 unnamed protein product [Pieris brassicae]